MDIFDSQVHLGPGGAAEMVAAMDALGVAQVLVDEWWIGTPGHPYYGVGDGGVAVRTTSPTSELACWTYPGRFAYLIRVDRRDPDLHTVVRLARDNPHIKALRISPGMSRAEIAAFGAGEDDPVFAAAADFGFPIFVQIAGNCDMLARYVAKFPTVKIIVCHTGMPPGKAMAGIIGQMEGLPDSAGHWAKVAAEPKDQAFAKVLRAADHANVGLKWAHAPTMFDSPGFPNAGTHPFLRKAVAAFGAERIMWASDISANQTGESWAELIFAIRNNPDLAEKQKEFIMGGTARSWLGLEKKA
jgi:predicted TIM-barrel fold metal-dependent hydrolase